MIDIPCVILAGGKSSRMKEDKCFLDFKNTSLINYQYTKLKKIFSKVYISSKTNKFNFSCDLILENNDIFSPLIALNEIIVTLQDELIFIITVDTPNISKKTIETIIKNSKTYDICIVKTQDNKVHNLCGTFSKNIELIITNMINKNDHKISNLIKNSNSKVISLNSNEFFNINTKKDYKFISQQIHK